MVLCRNLINIRIYLGKQEGGEDEKVNLKAVGGNIVGLLEEV